MIENNTVFRPDFLAVVSQLALASQVTKLQENSLNRATKEKGLPSNLLLKIQCEATDEVPAMRLSSIESLPLDGLTRGQR
jgi:hypothetical protein